MINETLWTPFQTLHTYFRRLARAWHVNSAEGEMHSATIELLAVRVSVNSMAPIKRAGNSYGKRDLD